MKNHGDDIRKLAETPLGRHRFEMFIRRYEINCEPPPAETKVEKYVLGRQNRSQVLTCILKDARNLSLPTFACDGCRGGRVVQRRRGRRYDTRDQPGIRPRHRRRTGRPVHLPQAQAAHDGAIPEQSEDHAPALAVAVSRIDIFGGGAGAGGADLRGVFWFSEASALRSGEDGFWWWLLWL